MKKHHKLTALILAAVMSVSMIPTAAFADEVGETEEVTIESTETESNLSEEESVIEETPDDTVIVNEASETSITEEPVDVLDDTEAPVSAADEQDYQDYSDAQKEDVESEVMLLEADSINTSSVNVKSDLNQVTSDNIIPSDAEELNGHFYYIYNIGGTYEDAEKYCESLNGHLATITSQSENDFLFNYMQSKKLENAYFGLTDCENEGVWKWINGESVIYTNWAVGEPNAENAYEDYAMFYWKYKNGEWNDGNYGNGTVEDDVNFICEWDSLSGNTNSELKNMLISNSWASLAYESGYEITKFTDDGVWRTYRCEADADTGEPLIEDVDFDKPENGGDYRVEGGKLHILYDGSLVLDYVSLNQAKQIWEGFNNPVFQNVNFLFVDLSFDNTSNDWSPLYYVNVKDLMEEPINNPLDDGEIDENTIVYYNNGIKTPERFNYSLENCLRDNSFAYNPQLAHMLIALATAAYQDKNDFTLLKDCGGKPFPENPLAITDSLRNLGFSAMNGNIKEYNYYTNAFDPGYGKDTSAFTIATKKSDTGEDIVIIVIRGSYGGWSEEGWSEDKDQFQLDWSKWSNDWQGNTSFHNYDVGYHEGFYTAAGKIEEELKIFLSTKSIDKRNAKFLVTGHSRGAAIGNLVAKDLIDGGTPSENVYDYNFACPDTARDYDGNWNVNNKYGGIFNINNVKDIIGVIPGNLFNASLNHNTFFTKIFNLDPNFGLLFWGKYGNTCFFAKHWDTVKDTVLGNPMNEHQPTYYLTFLRDEPTISTFRSWEYARLTLTENAAREGLTEIGKMIGIFCPVDVTIKDKNGTVIAEIQNGEQVYYNDSFGDVVILSAGDQSLVYLKEDYYTITLKGTDNGTLNYFVADILEEENEKALTFENIDLFSEKTIENILNPDTPITDSKLFVLDQEGNPIRIISEEGVESEIDDETDISWFSDGCYISSTPISSEANANGIEIELDKSKYAIQEGDILTIDATIKTDKDHVEGQKEYIGYFAYYANKQWNQLASWKIEGGTTKYRIRQKKANWPKYGDVIFTVSVFPMDSFTQGSALIDKSFLVNITKKPETPGDPSITDSGTCGDNLTWTLDKKGTLTISGEGKMKDYSGFNTPWYNNDTIKEVVIEENVTSIGKYAFYQCGNLKSINIPESVTSIGSSTFYKCSSLESVNIPEGVTIIATGAFEGCSNLKSVTIPEGVTSIESRAFNECSSLTSINIPEGVTSIDSSVFSRCSSLTNINIPEGVTSIGYAAFTKCSSLTNINIPEGVTSIERDAFSGCSSLTSINIPDGVRNIGIDVFNSCSSLIDINIPNSVTVIRKDAFEGCTSLSNIRIPEGVTFIETGAFRGCSSLTSIYFIGDAPEFRESCFSDVTANAYYPEAYAAQYAETATQDCGGNICWIPWDLETVDIASAEVTGIANKTYTGSALKPVPTVKLGTVTLKSGTDYTVAYKNNTNAGTATVTITGIGNYTGSISKTFKITLAKPVLSTVSNVNGGVKFAWKKVTGAEKYRVFRKAYNTSTKKWSGWAKIADTTTVSYTDKSVKSGTKYKYTARCVSSDGKTFTSDYDTAGKAITYVAAPAISNLTNMNSGVKITWGKSAGAAKYRVFRKAYNVSTKKWSSWTKVVDAASVAYTDTTVKNGTTYSYTIRCLNSAGKFASAYNTTGKKITYVARPTISSLTSAKTKTMLVKWAKNAKATGYQIQYSTSSTFASGNKTVTVKGAAAVSKTITSLTAKKKYYVRIRTYKTVSGKNYYSAWSAVKNVTTK